MFDNCPTQIVTWEISFWWKSWSELGDAQVISSASHLNVDGQLDAGDLPLSTAKRNYWLAVSTHRKKILKMHQNTWVSWDKHPKKGVVPEKSRVQDTDLFPVPDHHTSASLFPELSARSWNSENRAAVGQLLCHVLEMLGPCAKTCEGLDTFYCLMDNHPNHGLIWVNNQELFSCSVAHTLLELAQKKYWDTQRPALNPQKMDQTYSQLAINRGTREVVQSLGMGSTQTSASRNCARSSSTCWAPVPRARRASSIGWYTRFTWFILVQEISRIRIPIFWSPNPSKSPFSYPLEYA